MKRLNWSLLVAALVLTAPSAYALSPQDAQFVSECRANVVPPDGALSVDKAEECAEEFNADGGRLMKELQAEQPALAVEVVARNNSLIDLRYIIDKYVGPTLSVALTRALEKEPCVCCKMGLGPKPEALSGWVEANTLNSEANYNAAIHRWDAMWDPRRQGLAGEGFGFTGETWSALKISERYKKVYEWAKLKSDELLASSAMAEEKGVTGEDYSELIGELKKDLGAFGDWDRIKKLNEMSRKLSEKAAEKKKPAAPTSVDKKGEELDAASGSLAAARAAGSEGDYLAAAFDNAYGAKGGPVLPARPGTDVKKPSATDEFKTRPITKRQAAALTKTMLSKDKQGRLTGHLAAEIRDTKAGDEIIAFYEGKQYAADNGNKLNFGFVKAEGELKGALGWWSGTKGELRINSDMVDKFAAERKVTPAQILKDPALQKDLATYIAPVFVHEGTHQRQTAWSKANGLDFLRSKDGKTFSPYQMEQETESFSMNAAFVAEKAKKGGTAYLSKLAWYDRADAERYLEDGVEGLRTEKHTYNYYAKHTDSVAGASAKQLEQVHTLAQSLEAREALYKANPKNFTPAAAANLRKDRESFDVRFKWYRDIRQKSSEDELKLLEWRTQMDSDGSLLRSIKGFTMPGGGK